MKASQLLLGFLVASAFVPLSFAQSSPSVSVTVNRAPVGPKAGSPAPKAPKTGQPLATIDGQPITESELAPLVEGQLRSVREQEYQVKKKALDNLIGQRILEAEAKKRGLTSDKLLEQEVDAKIPEPTDVEIGAVYDVQREQLNRSREESKSQISQAIKRARIQQARQEYSSHLREQAKIAVLLDPPRVTVSFDATRVRGNPKAKVMIVEFSDFQCPFCRQVETTLKNVMGKYSDQVALAFRDFPLQSIHAQAQGAAEASHCALEQGKYWEYHDLLFSDQAGLEKSGLLAKAQKLQLDDKKFEACLSGGKYKTQVELDSQDGRRLGVTGTPGFFINGVFLNGAQPESAFEAMIKDELAAAARP
jgi:protein-disulfide isomerase